uniref:M7GpppX diphosphatase n=1 Tax=Plectus sambesii TaxID=2011161 RepID=A0A914VWC8_9BILA
MQTELLRDLTADHLPMLENLREKSLAALREKYGIRPDQVKAYFHYQPSFYHLHVHMISVKYDAPASGTTSAILLNDVINNLHIAGDFYRRASLTFSLKKDSALLNAFREAGRAQS